MTSRASAHIQHHEVPVGDVELHAAVCGQGPAVVLCHGFPGLWYSWRHQLPALAAAGYRAIALDMRGYGRSSAPTDSAAYDRVNTVADVEGVLDAFDVEQAVFVGHDFGAHLVWDLPDWLPDRVRGLFQLSVPRVQPMPIRPSDAFKYLASQHFVHLEYFQEPGVAEAELDAQPRRFLATLFHALSGANRYLDCWQHPAFVDGRRNGYLEVLPEPPALPWSWLTDAELDYYATEFGRTGFTGGLNWYRAEDRVWEQNGAREHRPIEVPVGFIAGSADPVLQMLGEHPFEQMQELVPGLRGTEIIDGAGHFVQMERPAEVTAAMLRFLGDVHR